MTAPLALYMEGYLGEPFGKMGYGCLRYSPQPIACIVDSRFAGRSLAEAFPDLQPSHRPDIPIVATVDAVPEGCQLVLGIAPPGGRIPSDWFPVLDRAIERGLGIVNGLHEALAPRYPQASGKVWDLRQEPEGLEPGSGKALSLKNRRILMIGTDMAVGKMTAGLEILRSARDRNINADFVATGQIGIAISGSGVPLDAIRVDYASGAIEREVMRRANNDWVIVEGQGSLVHPGSTSTLPLLRGACPTDLILCCRAGQTTLARQATIAIPPLRDLATLYEDLSEVCGTFPRARTAGIAVNTFHMEEAEALDAIAKIADDTGLPACDPVRQGADVLVHALTTLPPTPTRQTENPHEIADSIAVA